MEQLVQDFQTFPQTHLGDNVVDTWHDDQDGEKALISKYIGAMFEEEKTIASLCSPQSSFMEKYLFKIDDCLVVFQTGMPDSTFYKQDDHNILLAKANAFFV